MKVLYFDCICGISGDMTLGALVDLGVDLRWLESELGRLPLGGYGLRAERQHRHGIGGTRLHVDISETRHHRTFAVIREMIEGSALADDVKELALRIFRTLAEAEARVHGVDVEEVHFHEVGAVDSIVDIVGAALCLRRLAPERVTASPLPLGTGFIDAAHGRMPVPAPASLEILRGVPTAPSDIRFELTTPTGAAIIKTVADGFGPLPPMTIGKSGYGVGSRDFAEAPNVLRVIEGELRDGGRRTERLTVIETNVDDMSPEAAGYLMERLLSAGALDVFFTAVQMKKNRPGLLVTVLAEEHGVRELTEIIFSESTTLGVRTRTVERISLPRKTVKVETPYGTVRVKAVERDGRFVDGRPEFEDCRAAAAAAGAPLVVVMDAAREAARRELARG
ncbi:MAG TPA: nickel pincer cofactor biosynthesis protein LarC [Deltaproteobacteria bacterium]|nr:nickel pincer cofactor biosynthesis protein LarC [Deltaproteobacteria bacterium]